jgi:glycosyltransferase involved in cell wall biosynthesis
MVVQKMSAEIGLWLSKRGEKIERPLLKTNMRFEAFYCVSLMGCLKAYLAFLWFLLRNSEAQILTDSESRIGFLAWLPARILKRKLILRSRGNAIRECKAQGYTVRHFFNQHFFYPYLTGIIACSNYLKDQLSRDLVKFPNIQFSVVSLPMPLVRKREVRKEKIILLITKFDFYDKVKYLIPLLEQINFFLDSRPDFRFDFVGGGEHLDKIRSTCDHFKNKDKIYFTGQIDDVSTYYSRSFCFLYVSGLDGYPSVIDEAILHGLPVVTNKALGFPEIIDDGFSGFFLNDQYSNLIDIIETLETPELYDRIVQNAPRRVFDNNSPAIIGEQFKTSIQKVLSD